MRQPTFQERINKVANAAKLIIEAHPQKYIGVEHDILFKMADAAMIPCGHQHQLVKALTDVML